MKLTKPESPTGAPVVPPGLVPYLAVALLVAYVAVRAAPPGPWQEAAKALLELGTLLGLVSPGLRKHGGQA